jgi:hypothetical protein
MLKDRCLDNLAVDPIALLPMAINHTLTFHFHKYNSYSNSLFTVLQAHHYYCLF